ncbi:hypothetical protein [Sorangium sp. So ce1389]|uniref:hypothetical protein n=1 Tax=Sorangium sp. So ce1389 TaxID=3133336 RepID=UPI003F63A534
MTQYIFRLATADDMAEIRIAISNPSIMALMRDDFRTIGLAADVAGVHYELGMMFPEESAPRMAEIARQACARDPGMVWRLPGLES